VGSYSITITLTDSGGVRNTYTCWIYVINRAPVWGGSMTSMSVPLLITQTQVLPSVSDPDPGATISISYS
jgi:hypothetical protein